MKLRFFAGPGLVPRPGVEPTSGSVQQWCGRKYNPETRQIPATQEGFSIDTVTDKAIAEGIRQYVRAGSLIPQDISTAKFYRVKFTSGSVIEGVWRKDGQSLRKLELAAEEPRKD